MALIAILIATVYIAGHIGSGASSDAATSSEGLHSIEYDQAASIHRSVAAFPEEWPGEEEHQFNDTSEINLDQAWQEASPLQERGWFEGIALKNLYKKYKEKGTTLQCLLEGDKATATPWTDFKALETWGWRVTQGEQPSDYSYVQEQCTGVDLGDLSAGTQMMWLHSQTTEHEEGGQQVTYPATNADYTNIFFPAAGVLMANTNYGPSYTTSHNQDAQHPWPPTAPLPKLRNWSDVVGLTWLHLASAEQARELRWVFRRIIRNDDTQSIIGYVCKQKGVGKKRPKGGTGPVWQAPVWPGLVVRADGQGSDGELFRALLGTPNARGVVWLLAQRREGLGRKAVRSIRVWNDLPRGRVYTPSMLLEIGDVEGSEGEGL